MNGCKKIIFHNSLVKADKDDIFSANYVEFHTLTEIIYERIDKKNYALIDTARHPNILCGSNFCSSRVSKANVPTGDIPAFSSSENITRL